MKASSVAGTALVLLLVLLVECQEEQDDYDGRTWL